MKRKRCIASNIVVITFALLTFFMIFLMASGSLMSRSEIDHSYGMIYNGNDAKEYAHMNLIPDTISLEQYYQVLFATPEYPVRFLSSAVISLCILIGVLIMASLGGYGFAKFQFPMKNILFFVFIIVMMLPFQVTLVPNFIILHKLNLIDSQLALIIPSIFAPFGIFLLYQFIRKLPDETLEAARLEGAGEVRIFFSIVLPQLVPGITLLCLLNLVDTWSMVEQPLALLRDENKFPLSLAISMINKSDISIAFASGTIAMIPMILIFLAGKDYMIDGISNSVF